MCDTISAGYTKIAQIAGGSQRQLEVAVARSSQAQTQAMYVTDSLLGGVFCPIRHAGLAACKTLASQIDNTKDSSCSSGGLAVA